MVYYPKYALFYDFHTSPVVKDIGKNFDAEAFAARLARMGVDFISFPARCNQGMAYYDTKIGIRHYGLDYDLFGELVKACSKYNIKVNAYFNGGISQEECRLHPDWQARPVNGPAITDVHPFNRTVCGNTPYRQHLIAMACEVAQKYDVAGFFVDCLAGNSCRCEYCLAGMQAEGIDPADSQAAEEFALRRNRALARDFAEAVKKINPDYLLFFNGVGYENQLALGGTYLDFECIPTTSWCDYDYLPLMSRYMRTLGDYPRLNMTGRFNQWADFGSLRSEKAIRQELVTGLANGLRPNIGDHMPPDFRIPEKVMAQNERLFVWLQAREKFYSEGVPQADMAILFPKGHQEIFLAKELRGALRIFCELHCQFDVVTLAADWSKYRLLVLPDSVTISPEVQSRLQAFLDRGGKIISSGDSGVLAGTGEFMPQWGVKVVDSKGFLPTFFEDEEGMPMNSYANCKLLENVNSETVYPLVKPVVQFGFDGVYAQYYNPAGEVTNYPFLSCNGRVAHFSSCIFTGFKVFASASLRRAVEKALDLLLPDRLVKTEHLPNFVRVYLTKQPSGREVLHLTAHIPEKRTDLSDIIEDDLTILPSEVWVKTSAQAAYSEPEHAKLVCERQGEYLKINLPQFTGYALVALEEA